MSLKVIGAICILFGCGGCGFLMAAQHRSKIRMLQALIHGLDYMCCELQYRSTPLPLLCRLTADHIQGRIGALFLAFSEELESQILPDAAKCMTTVLAKYEDVDSVVKDILLELGDNLGKFDIPGQVRGLENVQLRCKKSLELLLENKDMRLRSYQTLGLCAGAAVAILFV